MMVAGLSRVLAPGLLLLATTTTTTVLQRAYGASYITSSELGYLTDDLVDACGEEILSCREDDTCASCIDLDGENQTDFEVCTTGLLGGLNDDAESSTLSCTDLMALPCCREEVSTLDCLENDLFVDANLCFLGMHDCGEDGITCDGVTVVGDSAGADTDGAADDSAESASNGASTAAVVFGHAWTAAAAASSCSLVILLPSPPRWA